jgi:Flp pilus assembly protein TadB
MTFVTLPFITGMLCAGWFLLAYFLFNLPHKKKVSTKMNLKKVFYETMQVERFQNEAKAIGWKITKHEFMLIVILNIFLTLAVAVITHNLFILITGFVVGVYLPSFLIEKKRQSLRLNLISKLVDPLRLLLSRLPEQQNITRAVEMTRDEIVDKEIKEIFNSFLRDVAIGGSVRDALLNMKRRVNFRKFDLYVEHLLYAHYEGFTVEAINALDKAVQAIEFDLRAIQKVREQSREKKKKLYLALVIAWFFPIILSFVSTGVTNVYLNTLPGKIVILFYVLGTIFVYIKGEEYLSLNLDEF